MRGGDFFLGRRWGTEIWGILQVLYWYFTAGTRVPYSGYTAVRVLWWRPVVERALYFPGAVAGAALSAPMCPVRKEDGEDILYAG